jgi:hypothetical protein
MTNEIFGGVLLGEGFRCGISADVLTAFRFLLPFGSLVLIGLAPAALAVSEPRLHGHEFTGLQSCQSSGCHGGGVGKDQSIIWEHKDAHSKAIAILSNARSKTIAAAMGIPEPSRDARCTVCHSPLESVASDRIAPGVNVERGVSCEACHGPAEPWLRFHTRKDITRDQRLAAGMREMKDLYHRANTCVACHLYLEPEVVKAGHPDMVFELGRQNRDEPPHWKDPEDPWLMPRAWLTGQATSLRELSWHLNNNPQDQVLAARVEGLRWLLRLTPMGNSIPATGSAQNPADRLARQASDHKWSKESTFSQLKKFVESNGEFRAAGGPSKDEQYRRAQVLMPSIDCFWQALKTSGMAASPTWDQAFKVAKSEAAKGSGFDPSLFAAALQQLEVAVAQMK